MTTVVQRHTMAGIENVTNSANRSGLANSTIIPSEAGWSLTPAIALLAIVTGAVFNLGVLTVFTIHSHLRNSFTVYVINLLFLNFLLATTQGPFNLLEKYNGSWTLGDKACVIYTCLTYCLQTLIIFAHFLIAVNRVWAVAFPFAYRTYHSKKIAFCLCFTTWLVVNSCNIPTAVVVAVVKTNPDHSLECTIDSDTLGAWSPISEILLNVVPITMVILAYPLVCFKSFCGVQKHQVAPISVVPSNSKRHGESMHNQQVQPSDGEATTNKAQICGRRLSGSRTAFATLTLMTFSVVVCLLPNEAYYTWSILTNIQSEEIYPVVDTLQRLTTIIDPILVVLGNGRLRTILFSKQCF